jgi:hypothetical protein
MSIANLKLEQRRTVTFTGSRLLRTQGAEYLRFHQSRLNLLVHIVLVPLFLAGNGALVIRSWKCDGSQRLEPSCSRSFLLRSRGAVTAWNECHRRRS